MVIAGSLDPWSDLFPDNLIPDIIDLVLEAWQQFRCASAVELEIRITQRFRAVLRQFKKLRRLPVTIHRECWEDDAAGVALGRIDLRFLHGYEEDVYFAFECKRLNVNFPSGKQSLASDYTGTDGMMCYVNGQYGGSLTSGGMLGYVMDGDVPAATLSVAGSIRARRQALKMDTTGELPESSVRPGIEGVKETIHRLEDRLFVIHHLFLGAVVAAPG